jgi:hypothetical protein
MTEKEKLFHLDKTNVIRYELAFLIENPEYLDEVTEYLANLTPEMVIEKNKIISEVA